MAMLKDIGTWLLALFAAVAVSAVLGSIVQTQFNLARLTALGAEIDFATRVATSGHDIMSFGPIFAALLALGFLVAFAVAAALARVWPARRALLYPLAGIVAVGTILFLMALSLPVTAIAAARGWGGIAALLVCGAVGGLVFLGLRRGRGPA
jgi:aldose sugar dehydrogenase